MKNKYFKIEDEKFKDKLKTKFPVNYSFMIKKNEINKLLIILKLWIFVL